MPSQTEHPSHRPQTSQDTQQSSKRKSSSETHPHDHLFKFLMRFRQFYLPFFQRYLPPRIQEEFDLNQLEPIPSNFTGPRSMRASDSVFRCPLRNIAGWAYLILECQSTDDGDMDWRTQEYSNFVLQYHMDTAGKADQRPPWIVPVVMYMGKKKSVQRPGSVFERLGPQLGKQAQESLTGAPLFVNWRNPVTLSQHSNEPLLDAVQQLMHHAYARDPWPVLKQVHSLLVHIGKQERGRELVSALLDYILRRDGSIGPDRATMLLGHIKKEFQGIPKEEAMSIADALIQKGQQEGRQEGRQEGEQIGIEKTATRMLRRGMQAKDVLEITHLSRKRINELLDPIERKTDSKSS